MALFVAKNGQLQTIKGIYYGMTEDYINATLFHNLVPKTATEIRFLYTSDNPDLTGYQKLGYCDNNNFIEIWNNGTKYILINPRKNYIYAPVNCSSFLTGYNALTTCIFNNFDTRNTTNMSYMFNNCNRLTNLDVSSFNTAMVIDFYKAFRSCSSLTSLDLSSFNTQNVKNMSQMFEGCRSLTSLDLSQFNIILNCTMYFTFRDCFLLITIIAPTWNRNLLQQDSQMFLRCNSIVGGNGTPYSSSHITAEYARIDGENGLAGYFTAPTN